MKEKVRERRWSESVAVGDLSFVEKVKAELGGRALGRNIASGVRGHELREHQLSYSGHFDLKNITLSRENGLFWRVYDENSM